MPTPTPVPTPTPTPIPSVSLDRFTNGPWLEQESPGLARQISQFLWLQDDISDAESNAVQSLLYIAVTSIPIATAIASFEWVQDGITDTDASALDWINNFSNGEVAAAVVSLGWVRDSVDDLEVKAIEELSYIDYDDAATAAAVVSLGWVQDGITDTDASAIDWINNFSNVAVAAAVVALGWVRDGVDDLEVTAIEELSYIANSDAAAGSRIVHMPFLNAIDPPDMAALSSLSSLAAFNPDTFETVMRHPSIGDGITDDEARIVAMLDGVADTNPSLISVLLNPLQIQIERRTVALPLTGDVELFILRTSTGAARSMDLLEHSVRNAEAYMAEPLPTRYVGLLFEDAVIGGFAGTNFATHMAILPEYDVDDGSHEAGYAGSLIAHEVAHYYWRDNADWVDEGASEFMASISENRRTSQPVNVTNYPCAYASSIAQLEQLSIARGDIEFICNYSLGERLFVDLYRTLGAARFRTGFLELYAASQVEDDADDLDGTSVGVEHVRAAFSSETGAEEVTVARWYDGSGPYDLSDLDISLVDPSLPGINGSIDAAYVTTSARGPAVSTFSASSVAGWVYLMLEYSYNVAGRPHVVPLEIVEYYEDGFEFDRRSETITAESQYIGGWQWSSVGVSPSEKWAPGRYYVYVYANGTKVAEVEYEVTP